MITDRFANVRFSSGRFVISVGVMTPPISDRVVSMSDVSPDTVTVSVTAPTSSCIGSVCRVPTPIATPCRSTFLNPLNSASTV